MRILSIGPAIVFLLLSLICFAPAIAVTASVPVTVVTDASQPVPSPFIDTTPVAGTVVLAA